MDYTDFTMEEFVCDESFQNFCLEKDEQSITFWTNWLIDNPEKLTLINNAKKLYFVLNGNLKSEDYKKHSKNFREKLQEHIAGETRVQPKVEHSWWLNSKVYMIAASIIILITGVLIFKALKNNTSSAANIVFYSHAGEKRSLILADGTNVILNGESSITLAPNYNLKSRELTLSGEAFFKVVHNAAKPFIVHTHSLDIQDIGTEFNVRAYPKDKNVEATLIKGKIELTMNNAAHTKIIILPQQKLIVNNTAELSGATNTGKKLYRIQSITKNPEYKSIVETDWTANRLTFYNESFDEIATRMERWYNVKITFNNQEVQKYRFVATFDNEDIDQVLDLLKQTREFNYRKEGNAITIY